MKKIFLYGISCSFIAACATSTDLGKLEGSGGAGGNGESSSSSSNGGASGSSSSSSGSALCNASNCAGCCFNDLCNVGNTDIQCGSAGQTCQNCTATNGSCQNKACVDVPPCSATSCNGCCKSGICEAGFSDQACGKKGATCIDCSAQMRACLDGFCAN